MHSEMGYFTIWFYPFYYAQQESCMKCRQFWIDWITSDVFYMWIDLGVLKLLGC